jgi:sensor c-di-GMP phosphodiesterase-like protein
MRRRLPSARVVGAWLALLALPLVLCLALSYGLSLYHFRNGTLQLAQANARHIDDILHAGDATLANLEDITGGQCSPRAVADMSREVFRSLYFREAGIERNGHLVCTSVEMLPEPVAIKNSLRTPAARVGRMEILSPTHTLQGGQSLILNRPLAADHSHYINLLLDPKVLAEVVDVLGGVQSATYLDDRPNGQFLLLGGTSPPVITGLQRPFWPGVHRASNGYYAIARASDYPVYTVIAVDNAQILEHWRTQMQPAVIAGFLLTVASLLLLRRFMPRSSLTDDLREGIAAGEMLVCYQPLVDVRSGRIVGAEALVRWQHPTRGLVMPDDFIALAERSGLVAPLTRSVLEQVKRDLESLPDLPEGFRIGINLARAHLADDQLLATLDEIFGAGKTLGQLGFEITERELLANIADRARNVVVQLAERGAEVALDDFGTGYSGLSNLRVLPFHFLKIDRSFVWAINTEAVTASLVDSIVALAGSLGIGLIAEGVETSAQRDHLSGVGVHLQQGWLYAKAVPLEELRALLARGTLGPAGVA